MPGVVAVLAGMAARDPGAPAAWLVVAALVAGALIASLPSLLTRAGRRRARRRSAALGRVLGSRLAASAPGYNAYAPILPGEIAPEAATADATDFRAACRRLFDEVERCLDDPALIADARRRLLR